MLICYAGDMYSLTDDLRIESLRPLISPAILMEEIPASRATLHQIARAREEIGDILSGRDERLLVVVGPCSIHDPAAAMDYARTLQPVALRLRGRLLVVMRTYFEKPRTTVGWKGLINDPDLNGSFAINRGLRLARRVLRDVAELGLPSATEFLDPITPQFVADLVAWAAIGARTSESQVHRELASGLSMPVGFKNGTRGTVQIAVDAIRSARHPHHFLSVTKQGITAIVSTRGNPACHVILRGGGGQTNYSEESIAASTRLLEASGLAPRLVVDCSHANSGKDPQRQSSVAHELCRQISRGSCQVCGVMLESFLVQGRQDVRPNTPLAYGQSITDACMSWQDTEPVLESLAEAVDRRIHAKAAG